MTYLQCKRLYMDYWLDHWKTTCTVPISNFWEYLNKNYYSGRTGNCQAHYVQLKNSYSFFFLHLIIDDNVFPSDNLCTHNLSDIFLDMTCLITEWPTMKKLVNSFCL